MRLVITGAAGNIGSAVIVELDQNHDLSLLDIRPMARPDALVADLSQRPAYDSENGDSQCWRSAFDGAQVVIHLAVNMQSLAPWEKVLPGQYTSDLECF